ncbi:MAG: hypothetical protein ACRC26_06715 [Bacteroidales bacterium]
MEYVCSFSISRYLSSTDNSAGVERVGGDASSGGEPFQGTLQIGRGGVSQMD